MSTFLGTMQSLVQCGAFVLIAFMVCLSLPQSKLRDFLMPIVSGALALFCGAYVISPIDVIPEIALGPFGLIDDLGAVIVGLKSAHTALYGVSERHD